MARLSKGACLQTQRTTTRQARHRKAGIRARKRAILAEVFATRALPPTVSHQGSTPNKQRLLCIGLCPGASQCWRTRFCADPSTHTRCITRPVQHLAFPSTHSVTTFFLEKANGKTLSIPPHAGHMTVYPRTEQVKPKAVTKTLRRGGIMKSGLPKVRVLERHPQIRPPIYGNSHVVLRGINPKLASCQPQTPLKGAP